MDRRAPASQPLLDAIVWPSSSDDDDDTVADTDAASFPYTVADTDAASFQNGSYMMPVPEPEEEEPPRKTRMLDFIRSSCASSSASSSWNRRLALPDFKEFQQHCARQYVKQNANVVWAHLLQRSSGCSFDELFTHCMEKILAGLRSHPRRFYIGITHSPEWRFENELFGHILDVRGFKCMHVLLKHRPPKLNRQVETALINAIYEGDVADLKEFQWPLSTLIHNEHNSPPGAVQANAEGFGFLYVNWC